MSKKKSQDTFHDAKGVTFQTDPRSHPQLSVQWMIVSHRCPFSGFGSSQISSFFSDKNQLLGKKQSCVLLQQDRISGYRSDLYCNLHAKQQVTSVLILESDSWHGPKVC